MRRGAARNSSRSSNKTISIRTAGWRSKRWRWAAWLISKGERHMGTVNAGARLDRLPISSFHRRIMWLIGAGMFFDGFDLYLLGPVLGATISTKFAIPAQAPLFVSATFIGMTIGALLTGFIGDRYGRRFTYQINLMIFGLASLAGAFAPDMETLIGLR